MIPRTCPHCDSTDLHRIEFPPEGDDAPPASYVHCNSCGASGPQHLDNGLDGWDAWNHRAGEPKPITAH